MTQPHGFTEKSFTFLEDLADNNDREWFNANKATFQAYLEEPFLDVLVAVTNRLDGSDAPLIGGKKTMFRMNRDVRFSEDKRPYKTAVSALLTPSGTKQEMQGLAYLHLDAEGGFAACGFHNLSPKQLAPIRQAMLDRAQAFDGVLGALAAAGRDLDRENALTSMPRGFSDADDHRHADAIKLKSLLVREDLPKVAWTSGDVVDRVAQLVRDAAPLLSFEKPA